MAQIRQRLAPELLSQRPDAAVRMYHGAIRVTATGARAQKPCLKT
jgi:hypothetical protein